MILFNKLVIGYKEALATSSELILEKGNCYALLGRNGKGKSTLLKTIMGQIPAISGNLSIENKEIQSISSHEKAQLISWVDTRFSGIEFLSVRDYVALGRTPNIGFLSKLSELDFHKIDEALQQVGIMSLATKDTNQISDGEKQLCSIARALAQDTPIILLDEPTAFLDFHNKKLIFQLLAEIATLQNKCIICSTHDLESVVEGKFPMIVIDNSLTLAKKNPSNSIQELHKVLI